MFQSNQSAAAPPNPAAADEDLSPERGRIQLTCAQMREWVRNPVAYRIEYRDGTKATMLLLNGLVTDFTFAAKLKDSPRVNFVSNWTVASTMSACVNVNVPRSRYAAIMPYASSTPASRLSAIDILRRYARCGVAAGVRVAIGQEFRAIDEFCGRVSVLRGLDRRLVMNAINHAAVDVPAANSSRIGRYAAVAARVLLGLIFFVFGLEGFLHFMPQPAAGEVPEKAMAFGAAMMSTGYLFKFVKATEVLVGILLLSKRAVPLALVILAPITLNIFAFHAFLAPSGLPMAIVVLALQLYLAWTRRDAYRPLFAR